MPQEKKKEIKKKEGGEGKEYFSCHLNQEYLKSFWIFESEGHR